MKTELLSPAKDLATGIAAINHGADAVYIGGPMFGARAAAGNSLEDLERLTAYAHRFRARIFVTVNTILSDEELLETERLMQRLYQIGTDAFIVQDMGVLQLNLPPVPLHASTQADNRSPEKVAWLQQAGFDRVVLARELSLEQIAAIHAACSVDLEAFVHGALCVSYSGQCWLSHAMTGRSANRGACAQPCRLPWTLEDSTGRVILKDKHLLSLKDMDRSAHLREMIAAGVSSFKIEGRLKDVAYVKNITAHYRTLLDGILEHDGLTAASAGHTVFFFKPDPARTFHRGATDCFLHGRKDGMHQWDTPKSTGAPLGTVVRVDRRTLDIRTPERIENGDGLCTGGDGFRVNRAEQLSDGLWRVAPAGGLRPPALQPGTVLRRNADMAFNRQLEGESSRRTIGITLEFSETANGFQLAVTDEEGVRAAVDCPSDKVPAVKPEQALETVRDRLSRWGGSIYEATACHIKWSMPYFIPSAQLSAWRKEAAEALEAAREAAWQRVPRQHYPAAGFAIAWPDGTAGYRANILNSRAADFYRQHGAAHIAPALEAAGQPVWADTPASGSPALMTCKYCIRHALGWCTRSGHRMPFQEPLYLTAPGRRLRLTFDCKACEMRLS